MSEFNADDSLKQYLPDFDTASKRLELQQFSKGELIERLPGAYKNTRVLALTGDALPARLRHIEAITHESLSLPSVDLPPPNFPQE